MSATEGEIIECRAAVLWEKGSPLAVEDITVDPPKAGEVRVKMSAAGLCGSDAHYIWGTITDPILDFDGHPVVLGHEGAGVVESVGEGVTSFTPGDQVIALWMPECGQCCLCANPRTNLCQSDNLFTTLYHSDGQTRMKVNGEPLLSMCGTSTFSQYAVIRESQLVKISPEADLSTVCIIGCAVGTGYGSAVNIAKVEAGSTCAVWGLGAVGLSTVMGCKESGASTIVAIDRNDWKGELALELGATKFINPTKLEKPIEDVLQKEGGIEYAFDCIGNKSVLESAQKSLTLWGSLTMVGLAPSGTTLDVKVVDLLSGRRMAGGYYGNGKPRQTNQSLADMYLNGSLAVDRLITDRIGLEEIQSGFDRLKSGKTIRTVVEF